MLVPCIETIQKQRFDYRKTLIAIAIAGLGVGTVASAKADAPHDEQVNVPCVLSQCHPGLQLHYIGQWSFPWDYRYKGVLLGGISAIDYDHKTGRYIAISDDRSQVAPSRYYDFTINVNHDQLENIKVDSVTPFKNKEGHYYPKFRLDPESIRLGSDNQVYWGSEGHPEIGTPAEVRVSKRNGDYVRSFTIPPAFAPHKDKSSGVRSNLSFEGVAFTPNGDLFVSTEGALYQDGPEQNIDHGALLRFIRFDSKTGKAKAEYPYFVDPIPEASQTAPGVEDTGVSDILALDNHRLLVIERSYSAGHGNTIRIFAADTRGATNILPMYSLKKAKERIVPMRKQLVLDLGAEGIKPDNIEGITLGRSQDGKPLLIFVADDNFSPHQKTQFIVFGIDKWPAELPQKN